MSTVSESTVRIQLKAPSVKRDLIDKAAKLLNISRTDFMLSSATQCAEEVLLERKEHIVTDNIFEQFTLLIKEPFIANEKLTRALGKNKPWD